MQFFPLPAAVAAALALSGLQVRAESDPAQPPSETIAPPAQPSEWKVYEGQSYRIEADGNLSCYSEDGQNCKRGNRSADPAVIKPLTCGPNHKGLYGITGYDKTDHWCNTAYANLFAKWENYEMLGFSGLLSKTPNNDPMCVSSNGINCDWYSTERAPLPDRTIKPVVCGQALLKDRWGITGYEEHWPNHWCQSPEIVASNLTHPPVREVDPAGRVTFTFASLPAWTAADSPVFHVRMATAPRDFDGLWIFDRNENRLEVFPAQYYIDYPLEMKIHRQGDRFVAASRWRGEWLDGYALGSTKNRSNELFIKYGTPSSADPEVPQFVMAVPREKPRY